MKKENRKVTSLSSENAQNNVTSYIDRNAQNFPDRVALRWVNIRDNSMFRGELDTPFQHSEITFSGFARNIGTVAAGLRDLGITKGARVIIFLPMGLPMYTAIFAVLKLGAVAVFLDSWARKKHLGASAACVNPTAMISHKQAFDLTATLSEFDEMRYRIIAGSSTSEGYTARFEDLTRGKRRATTAPVQPESPALITFTTGSSGTPKGANRTHRFLCAQHEALSEVLPYTENDLDMPAFPIFSLNNLASAVTTILPAIDLAKPNELDSAALTNQILNEKITCVTFSPSMLDGVAERCATDNLTLPDLRRVVTGGAPVSRISVKSFMRIAPNAAVKIMYGATEVEPMAHIEAKELLTLPLNPDPEIVENGVNVGHLNNKLNGKIICVVDGPIDLSTTDWNSLELPTGEIGEFIVSGEYVCRDYYNNPEAFRKSKIMDSDGNVWHRTGDLARFDESGYLWIVGRIHNIIRRKNEYCFPVRAELILNRLPWVRRGAFLELPGGKNDGSACVVVCIDMDQIDGRVAEDEIKRLFSKNAIPIDAFYIVDEIPMDPRHHSKVEYDVLRKRILKPEGSNYEPLQ